MKKEKSKLYENTFDQNTKYKLYRNVYEIIHPTISKKNIADYNIIVHPELTPLRIFYPDKASSIKSVIIFIHGNGYITNCNHLYANICKSLAKRCNKLVIALDYKDLSKYKFPTSLDECYETIKFLYKELKKLEIKDINLIGDSLGANLVTGISYYNRKEKEMKINRQVLIYPILNTKDGNRQTNSSLDAFNHTDLETIKKTEELFKNYFDEKKNIDNPLIFPLKNTNYKNLPTTLVVTGGLDPFKRDGIEYYDKLKKENKKSKILNISFASHGFLNSNDEELLNEFYTKLNEFLTI